MRRIFLSAVIGVGMVAAILQVLSGSAAARTPEDYPLVCRGGPSMVIGPAPGVGNIGFRFTRGTKPASQGLAPGECSWMDRGMYPNEPDRVSQHVEEAVGTPENKWYDELHSSDKYWTFMVSNNGGGQLIATSARPSAGIGVPPKTKKNVPETEVPESEGTTDDPAKTGSGRTRIDCGMTLPCGGTVSLGSPAFSVVNLRGTGISAQGGGAGLFHSAIIAKNTNENGIGLWSVTASNDANVVITNTGSGDLIRGFSGGSGGELVFQVQNSGITKVRALEANTTSGDASIRGINSGGGGAVVGVSLNAAGAAGRFSNTKGGIALEVISAGETALDVSGTAEVSVLKIKGGADLAEQFEITGESKPGMVVAIDPNHIGMLSVAKGPYNRRVIGILSGANELSAGMILGDLPGAKKSIPVALSGRVWVYADATRKAIEPGDLLTTAHVPGYAMAVTNRVRAQGAIIGKAMTELKHGKGMVLVFVMLQ